VSLFDTASIQCPAGYYTESFDGLVQAADVPCISYYGNGVADWDHVPPPCTQLCNELPGPTCQRYPPVPLSQSTQTVTGQAHGNGTYTVTASASAAGNDPHLAFDGLAGAEDAPWSTPAASYSTLTGVQFLPWTITALDPPPTPPYRSYGGAWLQLALPHPIYLHHYRLHAPDPGAAPTKWLLLGSGDAQSWAVLDERYDQVAWAAPGQRECSNRGSTHILLAAHPLSGLMPCMYLPLPPACSTCS
jgi:hypothetical protein